MAGQDHAERYDEFYFRHGCGRPYERTAEWLGFFDGIAERIVQEIQPRTVLDAGCAMGFLVESLRARGVEAIGIDVSEYALAQVRADLQPFCRLGSVVEPLPGRYDLVVCIEVLEHLTPRDGEQALVNLCQAGDDILFSSTPFDYSEATHSNVQPVEYWAERFALAGFVRDVDFDATFITPWAGRFRRARQPWHRVIRDYDKRFWLLRQENNDLRRLAAGTRDQLAAKDREAQALAAGLAAKEQAAQALAADLAADLAAKDREAQAQAAYLAEIQGSFVWRLARFIWRARRAVAPPDSWRGRWLGRVLGAASRPPAPPP